MLIFTFFSKLPGCVESQIVQLRQQRFPLLSSAGMSHFMDECSNSRRQSRFESKQTTFFTILLLKKKKRCWCVRLYHTHIAWRVSKGLSLEPGTSKEKQSLLVLCSGVGTMPLWWVESLCSLSAGSDVEQRWDTDSRCCCCFLHLWGSPFWLLVCFW